MGYYKACQSTHNRDSRDREGKVGQKYIWRNYGWKLPKPKEENRYPGTGSTCVYPVSQSCPTLCCGTQTPWTVARQAPLSMEFSRQEYWNGLPFPTPGDLPNPGIEHVCPALQAGSLSLCHVWSLHTTFDPNQKARKSYTCQHMCTQYCCCCCC